MRVHPRDPRDGKKGSVTGAGRLRECKNTEFVWELRKTGVSKGSLKVAVSRVSVRRASTVYTVLACDHALSLCLYNLFSSQRSKEAKNNNNNNNA